MSKKERRLAAIMFTDIVGYSSIMQKDEEFAMRMRERHREIFNSFHNQYGGKVLQYYGDGTLSIFSSTTDAIECAVAIQQALKQKPKVPLRVGIHIGDITYSEDEVYGDGVNVAARIEALCVPGGVFLSGKAYDDIKNHSRLRAKFMGHFSLKNIHKEVEVYAITNTGITVPDYEWEALEKNSLGKSPKKRSQTGSGTRKKKWVAGVLAIFFGIFGIHRFYLEQRLLGVLYLSLFILGTFILPGMEQLVSIVAILGLIDGLIFLFSSKANFDAKYNPEVVRQQKFQQKAAEAFAKDPKRILNEQFERYYQEGQRKYREYDFSGAIERLSKAIEIKFDHPDVHFLLARCYSINEDAENAFAHLEAAVAFGLKNPDRVQTHGDLAFLRIQPDFAAFAANNFSRRKALPPSDEESLDLDQLPQSNLLEQLNRLQKQWEAGELTDEEYESRKRELKSGD